MTNRYALSPTRAALASLGLGIVAVFLGSALVLAGPTTPLSFALTGSVSAYMQPHFTQNWSLFAPDPLSEERGVAARYECADGRTTEFEDITTQVITDLQGDRLFPSRESRIFSNGILERFAEDPVLRELRESDDAEGLDSSVARALIKEERAGQDRAERLLVRYAAIKAPTACSSDAERGSIERVQLRYVFHAFPGWSSRDDLSTRGDITYTDSDWVEIR